jgi:hypothetical protein
MKCKLVQRRLLGLENPARVPAELRGHLARCERCRDCQSQLLMLESQIPFVPVPGSRGKTRLLRQLMPAPAAQTKVETALPTKLIRVSEPLPSHSPRLPLSYILLLPRRAAALAAAVVLLVLGWWIFHSGTTPPETAITRSRPVVDPLLASLVERDVRLAKAASPRERIEILMDMAQELQDTTRELAQTPTGDQLNGLAKLYEQVVHEGILRQALALPAGERRPVLHPIADRLSRTARSFERLAPRVPAESGKPLQAISAAAQEGNRRLSGLLSEISS